MVKIKLLGIGKYDNYSHYEFLKTQEIFEVVRTLLRELRFQQYVWDAFGRPLDAIHKEPMFDEEDDIKVKTYPYTDQRYEFEEKGNRVVVIFGKDKVFLSTYSDKETQKKIAKTLNSFIKD